MPDHLSPQILELVGGAVVVLGVFVSLVLGLRRSRRAAPPPFKKLPLPPPRGPAKVEPPAEAVAVPAPPPPLEAKPELAPAPAPIPAPRPEPVRPDWQAGLRRTRAGLVGKLEG
ncbi:MAG TPA: hypothetical protein VEI82_11795, partial [Myxococcota bacterium]|nr:hypothetical protein [Myxococcota bacterium]